ncbi:MAG: TauD/TfdA family dioxygenase [Cyanobacteria bacterium J06627_32]
MYLSTTALSSQLFRRLSPFGVEFCGLSVKAISPGQIDFLKHCLAESGVVVIREQNIDDSAFVDFLKRLGPLTFTRGETPVLHHPWLNVVSNVGRDRPPVSVFHTDTSYVAAPPAYTALRAVIPPKSGGETLFSNQYRAYISLPEGVRLRLRDTRVLHVVTGVVLENGEALQTWHPLFRRHPISNKIALYLSTPDRCRDLSDDLFDIEESQRIIRILYKHSIRSHQLYRHRWHQGDIVIWDNRCTLHRADHSQVVGDRVLHRGLVAGEVPIPLEGR